MNKVFRNQTVSPWRDLMDLHLEMSKFLDSISDARRIEENRPFTNMPACDVCEREDEFLVTMDMPGVPKTAIKIEVLENQLRVTGERKVRVTKKDGIYHTVERSGQKLQRVFEFPSVVEVDRICAEYQDGVLRLTLPKKEQAKPKIIDVKDGASRLFDKLLVRKKTQPTKEDQKGPSVLAS